YKSKPGQCWNAEQLAAVTGGKWIVEPPEGWFINSLIMSRAGYSMFQKPAMMVVRTESQVTFHRGKGSEDSAKDNSSVALQLADVLAGAIVSRPIEGLPPDFPLLLVDDPLRVAIELGFAARKRFQGKMIAVTGSAGKTTTCNMLTHVLSRDHEVLATHGSVNMRVGVPTIFSRVRQELGFAIIEISIEALLLWSGSITNDLPPNIAVVTSVLPVHLTGKRTVEDVAKSKSLIFCGMQPGGYAVLNRDMNYYEIVENKALALKLNVITFGTHPSSMIRMEKIINGGTFTFTGRSYVLECPVPTEQLYDALAVMGVMVASGIKLEKALELLKSFEIVEGRGNSILTEYEGKHIRVINSAYNANTVSMAGALDYLRMIEPNAEHRVAVIGDIAQLGTESIKLHRSLAEAVLNARADRYLFVGEQMKYLYDDVRHRINGEWFATVNDLLPIIGKYLKDGDCILMKSSHATVLEKLVKQLTSQ
ncbi:MAG: UDP-N-acetylmuramoyl-tripeptide--D-alanyl-D-alanine ligase, partial [Selenomonadaceae bacterium]|nr:UDP-N-acetylmuramoyl-tripeptide--D-alanyl-D-alanine ligase [Selenomonadaceae bacterium]